MNHKYREILVDCVHNNKPNTKQFINQLIRLIAPKLSFSSKYWKNTLDSGEKWLSSLYLSNMNIKINEFEKILLSFSFLNAFQISDSYINEIDRDIKLSHPEKHKDKVRYRVKLNIMLLIIATKILILKKLEKLLI